MKKNTRNWIVGTLITSGSILISLSAIDEHIDALFSGSISPIIWPLLALLGAICILLGFTLWIVIRIPIPTLMPAYECYYARKGELRNIYEIATRYFGNDVSPLHNMHIWHDNNNAIFKVMYKVKRSRKVKNKTFVGYYCVIPITKEAAEKLENDEIKGSGFVSDDIVKESGKPFAFYIGAIVADGLLARGNLRTALHNEISNIWLNKTNIAYTRPVTNKGLELVQDYNFSPIDVKNDGKLDCLYKRNFNA